MRRTICWRAAIYVGIVGSAAIPPLGSFGVIGVAPAEAKAFYTRKRVNGKWITGRFPKRGFGKTSVATKNAVKIRLAALSHAAKRSRPSEDVLATDTQPLTRFAALAGADTASGFSAAAARALEPATAAPSLPAASAVSQPAPASSVSQAAPVALPPVAPARTPEEEHLSKLREALQARAAALTTGSLSSLDKARPIPEAQSVSLDFKSGIKTTVFSDGTSVVERFDVGALRSLAAQPPRSGGGID